MLELLKSLKIHQYDCEHIDIRIEATSPCSISFDQREFDNFNAEKNIGAFIRVFANKRWYHSSTTELDDLEKELEKLLKSAKLNTKKNTDKKVDLNEKIISNIKDDYAFNLTKEEKIEHINKIREIIEPDSQVLNPYLMWEDKVLKKYFINSKGTVYHYDFAFSDVFYYFTLKDGENLFDTSKTFTFQKKSELPEMYDVFAADFKEAKLFTNAPTVEPGKYTVILSPAATGVFAHESFGHKSEADFMIGDETMKKEWEIGKMVANEKVSIVDCGKDPTNTGYCPIDDEGNESKTTYLIKNGRLTGRLHSVETAKILEEEITGNARAINFEFDPIVRMTNTYFEKGDLTFEQLLEPIKEGYFIKTVSHGSGMSTFTMAVNRAYKIKNGNLTHPVKINVTTGTVFETLHNIDGVSDTVEIKNSVTGGCGKNDQFPLMVAYGGPYLRIKSYNIS